MGELTIRVGDAETLKALSELADLHGHPIETEAQELLRRAVKDYARRLEPVRWADEIAAMRPEGQPKPTPLHLSGKDARNASGERRH